MHSGHDGTAQGGLRAKIGCNSSLISLNSRFSKLKGMWLKAVLHVSRCFSKRIHVVPVLTKDSFIVAEALTHYSGNAFMVHANGVGGIHRNKKSLR